MKQVYFDSAATSQMRPEVIQRMAEIMHEVYGNPSSTHAFGRTAKSIIETARKNIAKQLNVTPAEIIFTSGGTEADNMILHGAVRDLGVKRIITSPIEHHAILYKAEELKNYYAVEVIYLRIDKTGSIDYTQLEELLQDTSKKTLVTLMHVNNEIGTLLDIERVAEICKQTNTLFHSDTVQSIGHFHLDFSKIPLDFASVAAHKFHGPKGAGFAFVRKNSGLHSLIFGGAQERGLRAGTESVHNIAGLDTAFTLAYKHLEEDRAYISSLKKYFIEQLRTHIPGVKFNGCCDNFEKSTYNLINVALPLDEKKSLILLFHLDLNGIACSKGSACQSGSTKGSHVLDAVQDEADKKKPSLRFSLSSFNTQEEIDYAVKVLSEFIYP
ncbi:MAG TPA: cysteine desulfurase family protein [Flavobacteriaceae bacterium]|nr:cysteine desulfurase family protein [Flavobacteriaceae bacterium]